MNSNNTALTPLHYNTVQSDLAKRFSNETLGFCITKKGTRQCVQSLFIVQLYIHKENSIAITLIVLMNTLDVITVLAPCIADSSSAYVAPTLSPSSAEVAAIGPRSALVMLQAVFSLIPSVVGGTCLTSWISLVDSLPSYPCTKWALLM